MGMSVFSTPIGDCAVVWSDAGVCGVLLPEASTEELLTSLRRLWPGHEVETPPPGPQRAIDGILALLSGGEDALDDVVLDLDGVSDLRQQIYAVLRTVGPGETITYGEIAERLEMPNGAREIGQAMGRNPVPLIVPCHRVLAAGGKLGGFSAPGGVVTKTRLLAIEGASLF